MILTCPACTMRYLVSEGAIGPKGRRVRCANCGHQWTQAAEEGLDEELFGEAPEFLERPARDDDIDFSKPALPPAPATDDIEDDLDFQAILRKELESSPIPAGVLPEPEDPVMAQLGPRKGPAAKRNIPTQKLAGFASAAVFYALVIGILLMMQPQISRAWPPSNLVYGLLGLKPAMPGEGLALDNLHAELADGHIAMAGTILNLKSQDVGVPSVMASIVDDDGKIIDRVVIPPPIARIKPEGSVDFTARYAKIPHGATDVTFGFSFVKAEAASEPPAATAAPVKPEKSGDAPDHAGDAPVLPPPADPAKHDSPPAHTAPAGDH